MTVALSIPCMGASLRVGIRSAPPGTPYLPARSASPFAAARPGRLLARERARVLVVARNLVIKVTAGKDEPERCNQAFTVASTAVVSGVPVSLWLTGEAAWFSLPGRANDFSLPHAAPLADLLASVLAMGTVTICSQCAARRDITPQDVIPGVRIAGAATFVDEVVADD